MMKATAKRRDRFPGKSAATALIIALLVAPGCKTVPQRRDPGTATLARELQETRQKMNEMHHRLSVMQFMVDSHERAISDLERTTPVSGEAPITPIASAEPPVKAPQISEESSASSSLPKAAPLPVKQKKSDKGNLASRTYTEAFAAMKEKNHEKALLLFREVAEKWPGDNLADNAIYWSGEIHYTEKNYSAAISAFRTLLKKYPKGSKAPDALLKTGYSFLALNDKESARKYLKRVVMEHPFTPSGAKAERALNSLDDN
ncbi:tol-pal system protein YbgF [Desulfoluna spongiiphila]|uniref:Tol-pal system protein YbgF n=1 Tax=Desulfoluna spongiiphila TaxID=419481 RepID=A0A1G5DE71_9BACT|nr:tol-pal system protein YbgF [Desulfoluna spongiiphila]SCY13063.1 tol-pal system protein YbgF [Desulfoluna spongiiphila]VVS95182.1 cell division coordinator cpob [Desulfoluna spongiiphila]